MSHGKELLGATVEDAYFSLRYSSWSTSGERFETYPEAFDAAVKFFEQTPYIDSVLIETRVFFKYAPGPLTFARGIDTAIERETLSRDEAERRVKLTRFRAVKTTAV